MNHKNILEYKALTAEESEIISKLFHGNKEFIHVGPKGYIFLKKFLAFAPDILNLKLREGDIFVTSYPRPGYKKHFQQVTTWCQELVWLIANDLNYEKAQEPLTQRYQFLEFAMLFDEDAITEIKDNATDAEEMQKALKRVTTPGAHVLSSVPSPRFIKSHLPFSLLPFNVLDTAKVIYMARDPRDMIVSYFHFMNLLRAYRFKGTFKEFWNATKRDLCLRMPYFEHVKEAWAQRHHPNMLFLFYEELSKDLPGVIERVADFLGKKISPEQTERLCQHLSFDSIKKNKYVNINTTSAVAGVVKPEGQFIRKGKVGGWRDYFDEEMERESEQWIADNLRGTDLAFPTIPNIYND